jgi:hypothetical protein
LLAATVAGSLLSGAVQSGAASAAGSYPLDPSTDLGYPAAAYGTACTDRPAGNICENIFLRALNRGRALLNAPAYSLPKHFHSLTGPDQLLVLANQDRKLYGRGPILGRNPTLNSSARRGAADGIDPAFVSIGGQWMIQGGSNWAGGTRSPLFAYLIWMYVDRGSGWDHRNNVLMPSGGGVLIMGVGSAQSAGTTTWTTLFESFAPGTLIECIPTVLLVLGPSATDPDVRILGLGFLHVRAVTFDGVRAGFERVSAGLLRAVPPPHAPGQVHVQIATAGGVSRLTGASVYTY